jgi:hypothetical protein
MRDTTAPKPFVFVLMPFDPAFKDIYKFGIKGAAEDVGAYAERLDEQMFTPADSDLNPVSVREVVRREEHSTYTDHEVEPFTPFSADPADVARLGPVRQYRFLDGVPTIPAGAVEGVEFGLRLGEGYYRGGQWKSAQVALCLRLHTSAGQRDFPFEPVIEVAPPDPNE